MPIMLQCKSRATIRDDVGAVRRYAASILRISLSKASYVSSSA